METATDLNFLNTLYPDSTLESVFGTGLLQPESLDALRNGSDTSEQASLMVGKGMRLRCSCCGRKSRLTPSEIKLQARFQEFREKPEYCKDAPGKIAFTSRTATGYVFRNYDACEGCGNEISIDVEAWEFGSTIEAMDLCIDGAILEQKPEIRVQLEHCC